jgi:hypothetical protein
MPLSIILLAITPARAVPIGAVPIGAVPIGAIPVGPVLLPLDSGGFSALGSGFNI